MIKFYMLRNHGTTKLAAILTTNEGIIFAERNRIGNRTYYSGNYYSEGYFNSWGSLPLSEAMSRDADFTKWVLSLQTIFNTTPYPLIPISEAYSTTYTIITPRDSIDQEQLDRIVREMLDEDESLDYLLEPFFHVTNEAEDGRLEHAAKLLEALDPQKAHDQIKARYFGPLSQIIGK